MPRIRPHSRNNQAHPRFLASRQAASAPKGTPFGLIITPMGSSPSSDWMDGSISRVDRQDPYLRIHCVNIFVRDQDRSLRFYLDQLGFDLAFDARLQSGDRWVAVAPPDGTAVLALVAPAPDSREYQLIGRPTGIVFVGGDVIVKYEEWGKRGVRFFFTPPLRPVKYGGQAP